MSRVRMRSAFAMVFATFVGACTSKDSALVDSALQRDLAMAAATLAPSALADTALAPVRRKPAASKPQVAPTLSTGAIAAGTTLWLSILSRVCTNTNRPGDQFIAEIEIAATGNNAVAIPAGSRALVEVASVTPGDGMSRARIAFRVRSITTDAGTFVARGDAEPTAELERSRAEGSGSSNVEKVIGGAILGEILGQAVGRGATGAAAGAVVAAKATAQYHSCLPSGAPLRLVLRDAVAMR